MFNNSPIMNRNEKCLIDYLSFGKCEQGNDTIMLIRFLLNHNIKFNFDKLKPVCNISDELEFSDNIKYN